MELLPHRLDLVLRRPILVSAMATLRLARRHRTPPLVTVHGVEPKVYIGTSPWLGAEEVAATVEAEGVRVHSFRPPRDGGVRSGINPDAVLIQLLRDPETVELLAKAVLGGAGAAAGKLMFDGVRNGLGRAVVKIRQLHKNGFGVAPQVMVAIPIDDDTYIVYDLPSTWSPNEENDIAAIEAIRIDLADFDGALRRHWNGQRWVASEDQPSS